MSIPPATHGLDQFYYLYVNRWWTPVQYPTIAKKLQKYFRNFVFDGAPGGGDDDGKDVTIPVPWPLYGRDATWMNHIQWVRTCARRTLPSKKM